MIEFCTMRDEFGEVSAEELSQVEGGANIIDVVRDCVGRKAAEATGEAVHIGNYIYLTLYI